MAAAVASDLVVNFFFVPPYHTLTLESRDNVITLVVYIAVAITVSLAMDLAARQRAAAARTGIEAELMARISAEPVREGSVRSLLAHVRDALHMDTAAIIETAGDGTEHVVAIEGGNLTGAPTLSVPAADGLTLVVEGPPLFAPDPKFLTRLAAAAARTLQAERLAAQAARARELAEIDRLRSALLTAVGHDLRTPLAGIKAGASSLRDPDLDLTDSQQAELLATIDESADRMADLGENLLAMSRIQAGHSASIPAQSPSTKSSPQPCCTNKTDRGRGGRPRRPTLGLRRPGPARTGRGQPADQRPPGQPRRLPNTNHRSCSRRWPPATTDHRPRGPASPPPTATACSPRSSAWTIACRRRGRFRW